MQLQVYGQRQTRIELFPLYNCNFEMKPNPSPITFPLLSKRLLRLQSSVFTKLYLFSEGSDAETDPDAHAEPMAAALVRIAESINEKSLRCAFQRVQFAGWKLIPQAQTQEEEDSQISMKISSKYSDQSLSLLPQSQRPLSGSNCLPFFTPCLSEKLTPAPSKPLLKGRSRDVTQDSSQMSNRQVRILKRALIMRKLSSIEAGISYLGSCWGIRLS